MITDETDEKIFKVKKKIEMANRHSNPVNSACYDSHLGV